MVCILCGEKFSRVRAKLGYSTCLDCGEEEAKRETKRKSKCLAPAYNKGAYQYVTSKSCVVGIYGKK